MFKPRHPGQTSHIVPPIANWHAGPSGMAYNPAPRCRKRGGITSSSRAFPARAANARIYAFTLERATAPASRWGREKVLLRGILAVGMRIGPDGALYLTDWITGWDSKNNGRLWKLDAPAEAGSPMRKEVLSLLQANFAERSAADVAALLRHADMRVRQKAQFDLVRRGDASTLLGRGARSQPSARAAARDLGRGAARAQASRRRRRHWPRSSATATRRCGRRRRR